jgi:hypothetical protein
MEDIDEFASLNREELLLRTQAMIEKSPELAIIAGLDTIINQNKVVADVIPIEYKDAPE